MRMSVNQTLDRFRKSETLFWIITSAKQWTYSFFWLELTNRVLTTLATEGWFQYFHISVQVLFHCEKETNKSLKTRFFTLFQMRNWWTIWTETKQVCVCVCLCVFVLLYVLCCVFVCVCVIFKKRCQIQQKTFCSRRQEAVTKKLHQQQRACSTVDCHYLYNDRYT